MILRPKQNTHIKLPLAFFLILACLTCLNLNSKVHCQQGRILNQTIPDNVELIRDVEYGKGGDVSLTLDIVRPKPIKDKPMPAIIFVHGGGWQKGSKESGIHKIIPLAQNGYFCVTINYRLTDKASFPAQIEDCKCAVRWARAHAKEYNIDPNHIGAWGSSAGGHLVALLGTSGGVKELEGSGGWEKFSSRVQAVADYFGPTDFLYWAETAKKKGFNLEELEKKLANGAISKLLGGPYHKKPMSQRKPVQQHILTKKIRQFLSLMVKMTT